MVSLGVPRRSVGSPSVSQQEEVAELIARIMQCFSQSLNYCIGSSKGRVMYTVWGNADPNTMHAKLAGREWCSAFEHSALSTARCRKLNFGLRCMSLPRSEDAPWSVTPYCTKKLERRTDAQGNMASDNAVGDPLARINADLREEHQILSEKERLAILGAWQHMRNSEDLNVEVRLCSSY